MARIGVSITKSVAFRNGTQEFSNVYYYEMLSLPSQSEAATLADNIVTLEKTFHGTNVTFVRARVWSQTGTPAGNEMIDQHNLSGTGARATGTGDLDKERAFLFRLRAGVDSRGNPVYLRKWFHACAEFVSGQAVPTAVKANSSGWSAAERSAQVSAMQAIGDANGSAGAPKLCSKSGRLPTVGETWSAHQFLEHHQLGDQWRAQ
jgi:hypothetical protein